MPSLLDPGEANVPDPILTSAYEFDEFAGFELIGGLKFPVGVEEDRGGVLGVARMDELPGEEGEIG